MKSETRTVIKKKNTKGKEKRPRDVVGGEWMKRETLQGVIRDRYGKRDPASDGWETGGRG